VADVAEVAEPGGSAGTAEGVEARVEVLAGVGERAEEPGGLLPGLLFFGGELPDPGVGFEPGEGLGRLLDGLL